MCAPAPSFPAITSGTGRTRRSRRGAKRRCGASLPLRGRAELRPRSHAGPRPPLPPGRPDGGDADRALPAGPCGAAFLRSSQPEPVIIPRLLIIYRPQPPPPRAIRRQERADRSRPRSSPSAPLAAAFRALPRRSAPAELRQRRWGRAGPSGTGSGAGPNRTELNRDREERGRLQEDAALPRSPRRALARPCPCPLPAELGRSPQSRRNPRLAPTAEQSPGAGSGPGPDPGPAALPAGAPLLATAVSFNS